MQTVLAIDMNGSWVLCVQMRGMPVDPKCAGSCHTPFLVACGGLLYLVEAAICRMTGSMMIAGVLGWDECMLPRLMAPCGKFVASMMDLNLYHWDLRNKGRTRVGLLEHLRGRTENVFSDLDPSNDLTVGEVPEKSAPSKKHPALPFPQDGMALEASDDSDYEVDTPASLSQWPARKLPARGSHPVGSLSEE